MRGKCPAFELRLTMKSFQQSSTVVKRESFPCRRCGIQWCENVGRIVIEKREAMEKSNLGGRKDEVVAISTTCEKLSWFVVVVYSTR